MPASRIRRSSASLLVGALAASAFCATQPKAAPVRPVSGVYAEFLTSRFASGQADSVLAARSALRALALDSTEPALVREAFLASALSGLPEAYGLARMLPAMPFAQLMVVTGDAQRGDWADAARAASALSNDGALQVIGPLLLAWIEQEQGHTDTALRRLAALAENPRFAGAAALHRGMISDLAGRTEEAAQAYAKADAAFGGMGLGLRQAEIIASFQMRSGRQADAIKTLAKAAAVSEEAALVLPCLTGTLVTRTADSPLDGIADVFLAGAGSLQEQGQSEAAALLLRYALTLRPGLTPAKIQLAEVLAQEGKLADARGVLASIPETDPLRPIERLHDAGLMHLGGDDSGAIAALDLLARDYPSSPLPLVQQAELLRGAGRLVEAAHAYDRAIARTKPPTREIAPRAGEWPLYYARGVVLDQLHQWPAAEADFRQALQLSPDQPAVLNYLGYSWADRGEHLAEASGMLARAEAAQPNDGAITDSLGWILFKQGDVDGAIRTLERAAELMPDDPTVNSHLGDAYAAGGRTTEAGYQWQRALSLHPDAGSAAQLRLKLKGEGRQSARARVEG